MLVLSTYFLQCRWRHGSIGSYTCCPKGKRTPPPPPYLICVTGVPPHRTIKTRNSHEQKRKTGSGWALQRKTVIMKVLWLTQILAAVLALHFVKAGCGTKTNEALIRSKVFFFFFKDNIPKFTRLFWSYTGFMSRSKARMKEAKREVQCLRYLLNTSLCSQSGDRDYNMTANASGPWHSLREVFRAFNVHRFKIISPLSPKQRRLGMTNACKQPWYWAHRDGKVFTLPYPGKWGKSWAGRLEWLQNALFYCIGIVFTSE